MLVALWPSSAGAAYLHTTITGEYGKEGPKATGTGIGCRLGYQSENHRLYLFADSKIYGLDRTAPGTAVPVAGSPFNAISSGCGDPDFEVDNSAGASKNNLYAVQSNASMFGWNSAGTALSGWPVSNGSGETCGVAVANTGEVWGGHYTSQSVKKFTAAGVSNGQIPIGLSFCKLAIDQSNNDLYVQPYSSAGVKKYTAASGYTNTLTFPNSGNSNAGIAVNGAQNRLYVGNNTSQVKAYDTETGSLVETINIGGSGGMGIAVDEPTDTLFVTVGSGASGVIKEITGALVPDVTTGDPIGNSEVSGSVDPAGGGDITECYFEFGTTTSYGSKEFCSPSTPYNAAQNVTANLPGLFGETTYHYRLVAHNANGRNIGSDKTITPHNVDNLRTEEATGVTRTAATLNGSFNGTGLDTDYYFEWGTTTAYGNVSAAPPGDNAGITNGHTPLSFEVTGLLPATTYHFRVVATNELGASPGENKTFTTLPAVQNLSTDAATGLLPNSATLNGSFEGDGDNTSYYFEYGPNTFYGSTTPVQSSAPGGSTSFQATISGLNLETTYHYRAVATNSLGTTKGADRVFTTPPAVGGLLTKPASDISQETITLNAEFEGNGEQTNYYFEYGLTTAYGMSTGSPPGSDAGAPTGPTPVLTEISEFEGYKTYHYRVVASNGYGISYGPDETFTTLPAPLPGISGMAASNVGPTSASLEAQINPNRWPTVYLFEWGTSTAYGSSTLLNDVIGGLDNSNHPVDAEVSSLTPATVYHFRVIAINFTGITYGPDQAFITPDAPRVESSFSSAVAQSTARLGARVAANARPTMVHFEYGTSTAYGAATPPVAVGSDLLARETGADLAGLLPGTTYHFRAVATNSVGTTYGPDQVLTTAPSTTEAEAPRNCGNLARRARRHANRAKRLRRRAARSSNSKRSRALRKRASRSAKSAGRLSHEAKACRRSSAGEGSIK